VERLQDYRKPKQAVEARREKRRGRGRPRKTWEDCVIDAARRKGRLQQI
jgi:predicted ArsR family transcriptional regulator